MKISGTMLLVLALAAMPAAGVRASTFNTFMDRIDLSGFLRIRAWDITGRTYVPDKLPQRHTYKNINYIDLFFRNRLNLAVIPEIEVRSVFDISSLFGKNESSIDTGAANFIPRDVYAVFRPVEGSELSIGLEPFSLPGGYILARDATGLQYSHNFSKKKVSIYAAYIRAFDNADDSFGQGSDIPDYVWDNVLYLGTKFEIGSIIRGEAYYAYENDQYTTNNLTLRSLNFRYSPSAAKFVVDPFNINGGLAGDGRKSSLHWAGLHGKIVADRWFLRFGGIFNFGIMHVRNQVYAYRRICVKSGLFEFETGYDNRDLQVSVVAEGATGDPNNPNAGISFQDIKGSHDFSLIVVDSSGGLALRGSGESQWYGLYGCGLNFKYTLFNSFLIQMKLLHFGTTKVLYWRGTGTTWYGDEADLSVEYRFRTVLSVFLTAGGFLPQRAYSAQDSMSNNYSGFLSEVEYNDFLHDRDNHASRSMIFEIMLGFKIAYD